MLKLKACKTQIVYKKYEINQLQIKIIYTSKKTNKIREKKGKKTVKMPGKNGLNTPENTG